jgi:hypothetical protein
MLTEKEERSDPEDINGITRRVRLHYRTHVRDPESALSICILRVEYGRGVDSRRCSVPKLG